MEQYREIKIKLKLTYNELVTLFGMFTRHRINSGDRLYKSAMAEFVIRMHLSMNRKIVQRKKMNSVTLNATDAYFFRLFTNDLETYDLWEQNTVLRVLMEIDRKSA